MFIDSVRAEINSEITSDHTRDYAYVSSQKEQFEYVPKWKMTIKHEDELFGSKQPGKYAIESSNVLIVESFEKII